MHARRRPLRLVTAVVVAVAATGCGGEDDFANDPRPPSPIVVSASITTQRVSVDPARFGAGPIELIVANQTDAAQQITIESTGDGPGLRQETPPINPSATATLKIDVDPGSYELAVGEGSIARARIQVGEPRPSAQDELLQP